MTAVHDTPRQGQRAGGYLLLSDLWILRCWGHQLERMFPTRLMVAHVGSSLTSRTFRDVDVRVILPDQDFRALCTLADPDRLSLSLSVWGQKVTGLPIDCQVQGWAQSQEHNDKPRNGMGLP